MQQSDQLDAALRGLTRPYTRWRIAGCLVGAAHLCPTCVVFREELATMFTPGVHVADNNNARGFPADGSVGHGVHTLCIPASSYGRITPFV